MAHELLDCADVVAALEEMRREAVAQCVRADGFCDSGAARLGEPRVGRSRGR